MIKLQVGKVYKGKINQQLVLYIGIELEGWMGSHHDYKTQYAFQYIDTNVYGGTYIQDEKAVLAEEYELQEVATTLYGRI